MKHLCILLLLALPLLLSAQEPAPADDAPAAAAEPVGIVTADRLNVRAQPGTRYEVLAQVERNAAVRILKRQPPWVGIQAPPSADAWLPAKSVDADGTIVAELAEIHAGPGIYYTTYGTLERGTTVKVERVMDELWVEIVPPEGTIVWVHADYLRMPKEETTTADDEGEAPAQPAVAPPADATAGDPGAIDGLDPPSEDASEEGVVQPHAIERVGYIVPLGSDQGPWTYALAQRVDDVYYPIAYIGKDFPKLDEWLWRHVVISGKQDWLEGWPRPRIQIAELKVVTATQAPAPEPAPAE